MNAGVKVGCGFALRVAMRRSAPDNGRADRRPTP